MSTAHFRDSINTKNNSLLDDCPFGLFQQYKYSRLGNAPRSVLEICLSAIEDAKHALTFSSGSGACTSILQLLSSGDHILAAAAIYGGTYTFITEIAARQGIQFDFVDFSNLDNVKNGIKSNTRVSGQAIVASLQKPFIIPISFIFADDLDGIAHKSVCESGRHRGRRKNCAFSSECSSRRRQHLSYAILSTAT